MPSMQDIADRVGVHRATVSNVLNGKFLAARSDAARRAVEIRRLAVEMGYRPSSAARTVRTGRTGFIGMLISSFSFSSSVFEPSFEVGISEALHAMDLCLVRDIIDDTTEGKPNALPPRIVREKAVDGLLINYAFGTPQPVRELLDRCRIPAVWINRKRDSNCVHPADQGAAAEATRYLLNHGHTRIVFVDGEVAPETSGIETHYSVADRRAGYEQTMREAGLTPWFIQVPVCTQKTQTVGSLLRAYAEILRQPDLPTAILCGYSGGGRTMLLAAAHEGLRVPEDLSVMTFDNEAGADWFIGVDRVLVRYRALGHAAVNELCALIEHPNAPRPPVLIPFEFHRTGTVARPNHVSSNSNPFSILEDSR